MYKHWLDWDAISSIATFLAVIVSLGISIYTFRFTKKENRKRQKFDAMLNYFDENIFNTVIPVKTKKLETLLEWEDFKNLSKFWKKHSILIKIYSDDFGQSWKFQWIIICENPTNNMSNTPEYEEHNFNSNLLDWRFSNKLYPEKYGTKISCINSVLDRYNLKIKYQ